MLRRGGPRLSQATEPSTSSQWRTLLRDSKRLHGLEERPLFGEAGRGVCEPVTERAILLTSPKPVCRPATVTSTGARATSTHSGRAFRWPMAPLLNANRNTPDARTACRPFPNAQSTASLRGASVKSVRMASSAKKKPPTTSSDGHESKAPHTGRRDRARRRAQNRRRQQTRLPTNFRARRSRCVPC